MIDLNNQQMVEREIARLKRIPPSRRDVVYLTILIGWRKMLPSALALERELERLKKQQTKTGRKSAVKRTKPRLGSKRVTGKPTRKGVKIR